MSSYTNKFLREHISNALDLAVQEYFIPEYKKARTKLIKQVNPKNENDNNCINRIAFDYVVRIKIIPFTVSIAATIGGRIFIEEFSNDIPTEDINEMIRMGIKEFCENMYTDIVSDTWEVEVKE